MSVPVSPKFPTIIKDLVDKSKRVPDIDLSNVGSSGIQYNFSQMKVLDYSEYSDMFSNYPTTYLRYIIKNGNINELQEVNVNNLNINEESTVNIVCDVEDVNSMDGELSTIFMIAFSSPASSILGIYSQVMPGGILNKNNKEFEGFPYKHKATLGLDMMGLKIYGSFETYFEKDPSIGKKCYVLMNKVKESESPYDAISEERLEIEDVEAYMIEPQNIMVKITGNASALIPMLANNYPKDLIKGNLIIIPKEFLEESMLLYQKCNTSINVPIFNGSILGDREILRIEEDTTEYQFRTISMGLNFAGKYLEKKDCDYGIINLTMNNTDEIHPITYRKFYDSSTIIRKNKDEIFNTVFNIPSIANELEIMFGFLVNFNNDIVPELNENMKTVISILDTTACFTQEVIESPL
jgi:hypothetical protein